MGGDELPAGRNNENIRKRSKDRIGKLSNPRGGVEYDSSMSIRDVGCANKGSAERDSEMPTFRTNENIQNRCAIC